MPEYPDITVYLDCLRPRVVGRQLVGVRLFSPFVLRTVTPSLADVACSDVVGLRRLGKRLVFHLKSAEHEEPRFLVIHLMIAGRLQWKALGAKPAGKIGLAAFDFDDGSLTFTEAGSKKRASLHVLHGEAALAEHDPGGLDVMSASLEQFTAALAAENHTLKRCLTDPRLFSGIGNAYSDEILHRARLSPVKLSSRLGPDEIATLYEATRATLETWTQRLRAEVGDGFPAKVTAFRPEMAVHGKYGEACPDCGAAVQRIVHAENETNYCARCQTGGKLLADRSLSRLLKSDWPRTLEELELMRTRRAPPA